MQNLTTILVTIAALLIGPASATPISDFVTNPLKAESNFKFNDARMTDFGIPFARADRTAGEPGALAGYSSLGIVKVNGRRIAVYALQNGARFDDIAGKGYGTAEVFDSAGHLRRCFIYRENLHSPPRIAEFIYGSER